MKRIALLGLALVAACSASTESASSSSEAADSTVDSALGEQLEPGETALVTQISDAATAQVVQSQSKDPNHIARRDAHPKAHGCVTASFTVNADVPADLRGTTFTPGAHYDTWIRFSNGSQADDTQNDARGMAIKLMNVAGARLLTNEAPGTHTHRPHLLVEPPHVLHLEPEDATTGRLSCRPSTDKGESALVLLLVEPVRYPPRRRVQSAPLHDAADLGAPLHLAKRYWSVTPYALGNQAVKYSATPCGGADTSGTHANDPNYLAAALKESLASGAGACFDFAIQRRGKIPDKTCRSRTRP